MIEIFKAQALSPEFELASPGIDATATTIPLVDATGVLPGPGILTIGNGEVSRYESVAGNNLTGCTRGYEGTAQSWPAGTKLVRAITAHDIDAANDNLETHLADKATQEELGHVMVDGETIFADNAGVISTTLRKTLYSFGEENESLTGGWRDGYSLGNGSKSKEANHLYLEISNSGSIESEQHWEVTDKISLNGVNLLKVDWEGQSNIDTNAGFSMMMIVSNNLDVIASDNVAIYAFTTGINGATYDRTIDELDVSALSGEYYVKFALRTPSSSNRGGNAKMYRMWGEA